MHYLRGIVLWLCCGKLHLSYDATNLLRRIEQTISTSISAKPANRDICNVRSVIKRERNRFGDFLLILKQDTKITISQFR